MVYAEKLSELKSKHRPQKNKKLKTSEKSKRLISLPLKIKVPKTPEQLTALRRSLHLAQSTFWGRLGVTQSGGSRYEQGRPLPASVAQLLETVYVKGVSLGRLEPNDFAILEFLKTQHPDLYASLEKAARGIEKVLY